ncbi:MAG: nitroreductase/quinone reductase family protein, partial [Chloroflexota bacterium]
MIEIAPNGTRGTEIPAPRIAKALIGLQARAYRLLGGRGMGRNTVLLTTVGARTGRERTSPLAGFADGPGRWLVVGSGNGSARHPAWFLNLARTPGAVRLQVGRE